RDVVLGRSEFLQLPAVDAGAWQRRGSAVANQDQRPLAARTAFGRWLLFEQYLPSESDRRQQRNGVTVRVIEYRLHGVTDAEPMYRLLTSLLDPTHAPATELAALYHERWEIETALADLKTHL